MNAEKDPTICRIPSGAIVERAVPLYQSHRRKLTLLLNNPDVRTAELMSSSINRTLERDAAHPLDSRRIEITTLPGDDIPNLLARVESIEVQAIPRTLSARPAHRLSPREVISASPQNTEALWDTKSW